MRFSIDKYTKMEPREATVAADTGGPITKLVSR